MDKRRVPGGAIAVVRNGQVLLMKGYGIADIASGRRVVPSQTLFRVASLTKLFTAVAVLQQVEQGRLGLSDEVDHHLTSLRLGKPFGRPVRLVNLLTHTAGFGDRGIDRPFRHGKLAPPLADYLDQRLPPVVRPPGDVMSYSNEGFALAGHLVEIVSGAAFETYLDSNVLAPLGMTHSSAEQPPPQRLGSDLATGYERRGGVNRAMPFARVHAAPAGAVSSTIEDLSRFLIWCLGGDGRPVLRRETLLEMQRQHFTNHPLLPGVGLAFFEASVGGRRWLTHGGGMSGYSSQIHVLPEEQLGIALMFNQGGGAGREEVMAAVTGHILPPRPTSTPPAGQGPPGKLERFAGWYRFTVYSHHSMRKAAVMFRSVRVVNAGDQLEARYPGGYTSRWKPTGPLVFQRVDGICCLVFRADGGRISYMLTQDGAYERLPWYEANPAQVSALVFSGVSFGLGLIGGLWGRRRRGDQSRPVVRAGVLAAGAGAALLIALGLQTTGIVSIVASTGLTSLGIAMQLLVLTFVGLVAVTAIVTALALRPDSGTVPERCLGLLVSLGGLSFVLFLYDWNLIIFR